MTGSVSPNRNLKTAFLAGSLAASMVGLGFAAVPLYRIFCETTGFGGTTMRVDEAQAATIKDSGQPITIRFDANHRGDLPWEFRPERTTDVVSVGARDMAIFIAKNESAEPVTGTEIFQQDPVFLFHRANIKARPASSHACALLC
jgi:cytochrome c oxidase assembly protein subunit 11